MASGWQSLGTGIAMFLSFRENGLSSSIFKFIPYFSLFQNSKVLAILVLHVGLEFLNDFLTLLKF